MAEQMQELLSQIIKRILKGRNQSSAGVAARLAELTGWVTDAARDGLPAHELERGLWRSLLQLGHDVQAAYFVLAGDGDCGETLTDGQGHLSDDRMACPGHPFEWSQLEKAKPAIGLARTGGSAGGNGPVAEFFMAMNLGKNFSSLPPRVLKPEDFDPQTVGGKQRSGQFGGREYQDRIGTPIKHLQTWLVEIGYSVEPANSQFNPRTARAVRHFQVHFEGRSANDTINEQTAALIRAVRDANPRAD